MFGRIAVSGKVGAEMALVCIWAGALNEGVGRFEGPYDVLGAFGAVIPPNSGIEAPEKFDRKALRRTGCCVCLNI